jgi:hypothetical protein
VSKPVIKKCHIEMQKEKAAIMVHNQGGGSINYVSLFATCTTRLGCGIAQRQPLGHEEHTPHTRLRGFPPRVRSLTGDFGVRGVGSLMLEFYLYVNFSMISRGPCVSAELRVLFERMHAEKKW